MALLMTAGPTVEPVTLAEAKAHLRLDSAADDVLVASLVTTSRLQIETALSLALVTQTWSYFIDALPRDGAVRLPLRPIQSIDAVRLHHDSGGTTSVAPDSFVLDGAASPARLVQRDATVVSAIPRRANAYEFSLIAGFGPLASDVPAPIRQALLLLVAHWYEHRDPAEIGADAARIPAAVSQLLTPWQSPRLT